MSGLLPLVPDPSPCPALAVSALRPERRLHRSRQTEAETSVLHFTAVGSKHQPCVRLLRSSGYFSYGDVERAT